MVKLLHAQDPDSGTTVPVVVDDQSVGITSLALRRGSVEGNPRALRADVTFDRTEPLAREGEPRLFEVFVHVLTSGHVVPMQDAQEITATGDLAETWDMASVSGGEGRIEAVLVTTREHHLD